MFICHHMATYTHTYNHFFPFFCFTIFSVQVHIRIFFRSVYKWQKSHLFVYFISSALFLTQWHMACALWMLCVCMLYYVLLHQKYFIYLTFTVFEIKICLWRTAILSHFFLPQTVWMRLFCMCFSFFASTIHYTYSFYST